MALAVTAQDEILKRIKSLDHEERQWRMQAASLTAEAGRAEAKAEILACKRRQYEFALQQLGVELTEVPKTAIDIPVKKSGTVIGVLG